MNAALNRNRGLWADVSVVAVLLLAIAVGLYFAIPLWLVILAVVLLVFAVISLVGNLRASDVSDSRPRGQVDSDRGA